MTIITDEDPSGWIFDDWYIYSGSPVLADPSNDDTVRFMPAEDSQVSATSKLIN